MPVILRILRSFFFMYWFAVMPAIAENSYSLQSYG